MPDIEDIAAGVPEDPDAPVDAYGKRGAYMPAVLANKEVWEGYAMPDDTFKPIEKMADVADEHDEERLLHVDENYRIIRAELPGEGAAPCY